MEIRNGASKTTSEIDNENWIKKQFLSSQAFHQTPGMRVQETTLKERFRPRILETFDAVAQQHTRDSTCNNSTIARTGKANHARTREQPKLGRPGETIDCSSVSPPAGTKKQNRKQAQTADLARGRNYILGATAQQITGSTISRN
jgi:hypothetical protein